MKRKIILAVTAVTFAMGSCVGVFAETEICGYANSGSEHIGIYYGAAYNGQYQQDSDIIGWRYKTVDGKLYKRQYNYSKKQWIGGWISA